MGQSFIDQLIINSPYEEPKEHWLYDHQTKLFSRVSGRRPAGYIRASATSKTFDDPGEFHEIPLVNAIRPRIKEWRDQGYPGVTSVTRSLLEHWRNTELREKRLFFCQMEAMETLIWLREAPESAHVGIDIPSDGGAFQRLCSKMATGSGKTIVMAMLIAWQVLNKVTYPQNPRFSKYVLIVAPGLTVRERLQVLMPTGPGNYYEEFEVVPVGLQERLREARVRIRNWQALDWESAEQLVKKRSVDKRGPKSDEAYVREVLGEIAAGRNIVVINDEAHHAWRVNTVAQAKSVNKDELEQATKWIGGLDRIQRARGILTCFDFSATPFSPSGKQNSEEALYSWIVSDFGLNDAIESGLVKTPRVVIRDDGVPDATTYRSKLYHIYPNVADDLNRKAEPQEPLPTLVTQAYYLLAKDWLETRRRWQSTGYPTPPVMITVANRTETAARIEHAFQNDLVLIPEICSADKMLRIDSAVLNQAESQSVIVDTETSTSDEEDKEERPALTRKQQAEWLREQVNTVGQPGKPGEQIQNVISVGMLSEGWDARTVTHIMGLRAFSSQLLCEQVVGRGLRRTSYDVSPESGLFEPEYVNIFGIPFSFLPHESDDSIAPPPPSPKARVEVMPERRAFEITWPNVIRVDHVLRPELTLDLHEVDLISLDASMVPTIVELAPVIDGKPDVARLTEIDLRGLADQFRLQKIVFTVAAQIFEQLRPEDWRGNKQYLLAQIIRIVERFLDSDRIILEPDLFKTSDAHRRILLAVNMSLIVNHIWQAIRFQNAENVVPVFDPPENPLRSTADMPTWYTGKPCHPTTRSQINLCVYDSAWEASEAFKLDHDEHVVAWAKNDHLGFEVSYLYQGVVHKYRPDYLIRLANESMLVLEVKGQLTEQDKAKHAALDEWVKAVNGHGGLGSWRWAVSFNPADLEGLLAQQ